MTDQVITHIFGDRPRSTRAPDPEPSPLGAAFLRWLDDTIVGEPSAALVGLIRSEFLALSAHAEALTTALEEEASRCEKLATTTAGQMEGPASPSEQYAAGYRAGIYQAACNTRQALHRALGDATQKVQDA